ncbi:MAG: DUF4276 family protein [Methylococcaceae bacterium]|nr:DUF4276 family protein [Methylococcaceae bacterium]
MVKVSVYVEGGATRHPRLNKDCRKGFSNFFERLGLKITPKIIPCGNRQDAYDDFCIGLKKSKNNEYCLLLVDSEAPVSNPSVWQHVEWQKPKNVTEKHLHFMVECMEAWFMADKQALAQYYGKDFKANALPSHSNIEKISKRDLINTLKKATKDTTKGVYSKGNHSFKILSEIDANKVVESSSYTKRLYDTLQNLSNTA